MFNEYKIFLMFVLLWNGDFVPNSSGDYNRIGNTRWLLCLCQKGKRLFFQNLKKLPVSFRYALTGILVEMLT